MANCWGKRAGRKGVRFLAEGEAGGLRFDGRHRIPPGGVFIGGGGEALGFWLGTIQLEKNAKRLERVGYGENFCISPGGFSATEGWGSMRVVSTGIRRRGGLSGP
jgi:hypothetical protein